MLSVRIREQGRVACTRRRMRRCGRMPEARAEEPGASGRHHRGGNARRQHARARKKRSELIHATA
eukprot:10727583-Alexandrium_andersonii.AAC.1